MMMHPPRRLFIGLMPGKPVQSAIQRHCRDWAWPAEAKLTRFGRHHLTLHFLGDVGAGPEHSLRKALREVLVEPLELDLCITEVWKNRVAVLRPAEHDGLRALHERTALALAKAGLQAQPDFKPHVTLARNAAGATPPATTRPIRWRVDEFALVWSVPFPQAKPARYDIVERFGAVPGQATPPASSGQAGEQLPLIG
jgi:2'-5' RNA ligase